MAGGGSYDQAPGPAPVQHYGQAPIIKPVAGEVVQVFSAANPNYRLAARQDGAVLAFKNIRDENQQWIKVDVGRGRGEFIDKEGQPGFILVNKATGVPLKHGHELHAVVTTHLQVFSPSNLEGAIIWTLGRKDEGHGYRGIRALTNIHLNLDAEHADKAHGGVRDGNRLILSAWKAADNFLWKVEPLEPLGSA